MIDSLPDGPAVATAPTLDHLALLSVTGADAFSFLDAQLTRNVPRTPDGAGVSKASLAGYCSPKGRLLASLVVWSDPAATWMLVSADIAAMLVKRLRMYVLRAKVTIADVTSAHACAGLIAPTTSSEALRNTAPWDVIDDGESRTIRFPDADGLPRFLSIDAGPSLIGVDAATWRRSEIRAGLPRITATTQDLWVPQMLNLEALGAVDFKKGCFPGQEVVARSQYLGKLKRRTALASILGADPVPAPGSDVWDASAPGEPVGKIVEAERAPGGCVAALVELPLSRFDSTTLRAGGVDGPALVLEPLPYLLPDNEVFVRPRL